MISSVFQVGRVPVNSHSSAFQNVDGDPQLVELMDPSSDVGGGPIPSGPYAAKAGRVLRTEHLPTRIHWKSLRSVPEVDRLYDMFTVSDDFKAIVETYEVGHQFVPVEFLSKDRKTVVAKRWWFFACNRLDTIDREATTMVLRKGMLWCPATDLEPSERPAWWTPAVKPTLVFSLEKIGSAQLWQDKHLINGPFITRALGDALGRANLSGLTLIPRQAT